MSFYECRIYRPGRDGKLKLFDVKTSDEVTEKSWVEYMDVRVNNRRVSRPRPRNRRMKCAWCGKESFVASPKAICCTDTSTCINNYRRSNERR